MGKKKTNDDGDTLRFGWVRNVDKIKKNQDEADLFLEDVHEKSEIKLRHHREDRLYKTFKEMKAIGMPVALLPGNAERKHSFRGTWAFRVNTLEEKNNELVGTFQGSVGWQFYVAKSNLHYETIQKRLKASKNRSIEYWMSLKYSDRRKSHVEILDVLPAKRSPRCNIYTPYDYEFDESAERPLRKRDVHDLFDQVSQLDSSQQRNPLTGIPFQYVASGCEARSHAVCRELLKHDVMPFKVWAYTLNRGFDFQHPVFPDRRGSWSYHTAPAVRTKKGLLVIDPALADKPLPVYDWFALFGNQRARIHCTSHHIFYMTGNLCTVSCDPEFKQTDQHLMTIRINLHLAARQPIIEN